MQPHEQAQFLKAISTFVQEQVERAVKPLLLKIEQLETNSEINFGYAEEALNVVKALPAPVPVQGEKGEPGNDGKDAEVDYDKVVDLVLTKMPKPEKGDPGIPGKDGVAGAPGKDGRTPTTDELMNIAHQVLEEYFESLRGPKGEKGEQGEPGKDGQSISIEAVVEQVKAFIPEPISGKDGKDGSSVTVDDVRPVVAALVNEAVDRIPRAIDVVDCLLDRDGNLCLAFSDGKIKPVGRVVGQDGKDADPEQVRKLVEKIWSETPKPADGKDGANGKDGVGFEFLGFEQIDHRRAKFVVTNADGSQQKTFELIIPGMIQRGMWSDSVQYEVGDCVTLGGSQWCAVVANFNSRPDTENVNWFLSVKRGRDGKQGLPGVKGDPGKDGAPGKELQRMVLGGE